MDGLKPILERRSCRVFTEKQVSDETVETMLRAGMYAPSAKNSQPWEFLVIRDGEKKEALSGIAPYWGPIKAAPLGILVMANIKGYRGSSVEFFVQDCAAATENILIAAQAMGLGAVWMGLYPVGTLVSKVRELLGIPQDIIPFSLIAAGYPVQMPEPHTEYYADKVHWNKY